MVEEVGEENVVQVVTDNASAYVAAVTSKTAMNMNMLRLLLMAKRPHLYWSPCAAHCIDLMLEDIGKIPKRAMALNGYIYNRVGVVNLMRKFTGKRELVRPAVTRFATAYITLRSIQVQKEKLRKMFTSNEWRLSKYSQEQGAKRVASFVLMPTFWSSIVWILKMTGPLVKVLRLVDGEKKPAMGCIYEAMDRAKEAIAKSFNNIEDKYKDVYVIIDKRWECQLHQPLHAAGNYLNPQLFYSNPEIQEDAEVTSGLFKCVERLVRDKQERSKIIDQLSLYRNDEGIFGMDLCIQHRDTKSPVDWWGSFGNGAPQLKKFAIRLHSKRRNRLEQGRLNCLVYVKNNRALKERYDHRDVIDPIYLNNVDDSNEWLVGRMYVDEQEDEDYVFDDNDLTWKDVGIASGAYECEHTRRKNVKASSTAWSTSHLIDEDEEDEVVIIEKSDTEEEEEEEEEEDIGDDETEEEGEDDFALIADDDSDDD
ncbi:hypothetical protein OSB04_006220 [Centaurea solstitialis]|uniref:DUF659 domain-containing protein n=1 Tax=Centaurea solstitialis TaxID=347529 RepID=A0AA38THI5_9ASTR|nr:hypothetical protein OSB04_006220 [Centaurea solstitialis]